MVSYVKVAYSEGFASKKVAWWYVDSTTTLLNWVRNTVSYVKCYTLMSSQVTKCVDTHLLVCECTHMNTSRRWHICVET